ncbi:hypothetical protein LX70_03989 [Defluviimonas denitrificans]|jgi:hypothetical protein|uniref:Uncharacterized protein n=1 Tax=Albidovulum denitrificans TaxID=404881 RepID=A0A2S8RWI3_9RHOB|nr:hypothetical protein LX70_03989 [Defluviimonas denitrificans]
MTRAHNMLGNRQVGSSKVFDHRPAVVACREKKAVGVQQILEWAFGRECAQIRTDPHARLEGETRPGVDMIWIMAKRAELGGVRIDTSIGRSYPHDDAEIVAAIVENLPSNRGGIGMAIRIAELARAGITPDWMPGARPRVVPLLGWRDSKHGEFARTQVCEVIEWKHRGRKMRREVRCCPVTYAPSAQQIAAARRGYLDWWGALQELSVNLRCVSLRDHMVTDHLPPRTPWERRQAKGC